MGAKAFMSYVGNGPRPGLYSGREGAGEAQAEAQRILGETERIGRHVPTLVRYSPFGAADVPSRALAESLAAFLALELDSPAPASAPGGGELGRIGKCWAREGRGETAARAGAVL